MKRCGREKRSEVQETGRSAWPEPERVTTALRGPARPLPKRLPGDTGRTGAWPEPPRSPTAHLRAREAEGRCLYSALGRDWQTTRVASAARARVWPAGSPMQSRLASRGCCKHSRQSSSDRDRTCRGLQRRMCRPVRLHKRRLSDRRLGRVGPDRADPVRPARYGLPECMAAVWAHPPRRGPSQAKLGHARPLARACVRACARARTHEQTNNLASARTHTDSRARRPSRTWRAMALEGCAPRARI